jgi:probable HAF family extracellular repeat protein
MCSSTSSEEAQMARFHHPQSRCASALSVFALLASASVLADPVSFQGLGDLPGGILASWANGVSADGHVAVGASWSSNGLEAFRWTPQSGMIGLGDFPPDPPFESLAYAVSADGMVVVGKGHTGVNIAFRWTPSGGLAALPELPGGGQGGAEATGASADGSVIVGTDAAGNGTEAFRWVAGQGIEGLGDLPGGTFHSQAKAVSADGRVVVGYSHASEGYRGFRWEVGLGMTDLGTIPGGTSSSAWGVTADGAVVVGRSGDSSGQQAFRWTAATGMIGLGDFGGGTLFSEAMAASADGSIIVGRGTTGTGQEAFIWDAPHGMRRLTDVLVNDYGLDLSGWTLTSARAISPDGLTIVGSGTNPVGNSEAWIAHLPEPSTLLALALLSLARPSRHS